MSKTKKPAKWKKVTVNLSRGKLALYAGDRLHAALFEVTKDMTVWTASRLSLVLEAVYQQGMKSGRQEIIEQFDRRIKRKANYLPPGRPKKSKRR